MSGRADVVRGSQQVSDPEHGSGVGPAPAQSLPMSSSLVLGALPTAPNCARLHVSAVLREWGLAEVAEIAELVTSELMTNAVQASTRRGAQSGYVQNEIGLPVVRLRLLSDGARAVIEVWDNNPQAPVAKQADLDDESGRGLMLVEALCKRWNWETLSDQTAGKVVWAELRAE